MQNDGDSTSQSQALSAIQDEVSKLLAGELSPEVERVLLLIESICRNGVDVRTDEERK